MSESPLHPPASDSDALLVKRTLDGDPRAFELLVIKYQRRIQRLIGRMVRETDLVEDIAQETFIKAYRGLPQFRGDAQFYTWLYRVAVNTAKKFPLEFKRQPSLSDKFFGPAEDGDETFWPAGEPSSHETPETLLAAKQLAQAVNAGLQALPDDLQQALSLREIEGLSYEEIAMLMDCPLGTVRSRIFRAREIISTRLKPMLNTQTGKRW